MSLPNANKKKKTFLEFAQTLKTYYKRITVFLEKKKEKENEETNVVGRWFARSLWTTDDDGSDTDKCNATRP